MSSEQSVASARAAVLVYDDNNKKWVPSGSSSGLSKVHIYQHTVNGTFRVVGRKLHDHEVVINCAILKTLKYNQATATFHQWRDNRTVYGLNFSSKDDAEAFAVAMLRAIEMLNQNNSVAQRPAPAPAPPVPQHAPQPIYQTIGSVAWSQDDVEHQRNRQNQQPVHYMSTNAVGSSSHPVSPACAPSQAPPPLQAPPLQNTPQAPPQPQPAMGHHRTSSAPTNNGVAPPPAPPPPPPGGPSGMGAASTAGPAASGPLVGVASGQSLGGGAPSGGPPPPPPPPPPGGQQGNGEDGAPLTLAAAIAGAKLKKSANKMGEGSDTLKKSQGSGTGSAGVPMGGMASMMDEMRGTLAKRRAQVENSQSQDGEMSSDSRKNWDKQGSTNGTSPSKVASSGSESPKSGRGQRIGSLGDTEGLKVNGVDAFDVDKLKQEIMTEIRREVSKMKQDIIEAIKVELNRR
ncbi:unnamed protein product [Ixodes persulcatus]